MKAVKLIMALGVGAMLSACATVETPTRAASFAEDGVSAASATSEQPLNAAALEAPPVSVQRIEVEVPQTLRVSEANRYYPSGDIVWREDPIGDRHAQVRKIFEDALAKGTADLDGALPVILKVEVKRFHALTEKARYTIGGVHAITFDLTILDAETGAPLGPTQEIRADLDALGGEAAVRAEARGITQKLRISNHLGKVIREELTRPEGYRNQQLGLIQAINTL